MVATRWTLAVVLAATAVSASTDELQFIARLLKRQDPGTPAYNCHDNCGQAIIQGRNSADVCNDEIFLTDYKNCLQCSGPDNQDIWQYYGTTLTKDASPCGLSTTPLSGTQPDVGEAIPAGSSSTSSTASEASSATSTTATEATSEESSSATATATATETPTATGSATSEATATASATATATATASATSGETSAEGTTESSTGYATASATGSVSVTGSASSAATTAYTPTGTGSVGGNGTATTSSGLVVVTNAANAISGSSVGFYGALALGALYAAAQ
ncbi:hypothetical protein F4806DRAFT_458399 [Annulohypoxylon nitens]|nr:hypothetical protein F4806DRAFT_458399 [Annulohypoxylon nitens]